MQLSEALERLDLHWPRDNKLTCPTGHQGEHGRSTPSLHLYENTNSFYCFSCGATGDAYGLLALYLDMDVADVLREYGDPSNWKAGPRVSRQDMIKAVIAEWQDYQGNWWPRFHALVGDHPTRDELIDWATSVPDQLWDGPLTEASVDPEISPSHLRRQVVEAIQWLIQVEEFVSAIRKEAGNELPRPAVRQADRSAGGPSGSSIREDAPLREQHTVRLGQAERVDEEHGGSDQASARLLRRRRLSR